MENNILAQHLQMKNKEKIMMINLPFFLLKEFVVIVRTIVIETYFIFSTSK